MNKREILIIINKIKDVAESDDITSRLYLTRLECINLLKFLSDFKQKYDIDKELIDEINLLISKRNRKV